MNALGRELSERRVPPFVVSGGVPELAKTAAERLTEIQTAISKVLTHGQTEMINGRRVTRADLEVLYREEKELEAAAAREARGGIRVRRAVPIA